MRASLSRPIERATQDGVVRSACTVLDYGCGRGDDVSRLRALGIDASGYDPAFFPETPLAVADVVNLGYVINVIEDPDERRRVLRGAYALSRRALIVSARLVSDAKRLRGSAFGDGVITASRTFQKTFTQDELRTWIEESLGVKAIAAAPGILYVFRDADLEHEVLAARSQRIRPQLDEDVANALYKVHREELEPLAEFVRLRGRLPREGECADAEAARVAFGNYRRAFAVLKRVTPEGVWEIARLRAYEDTWVYLALAQFSRRPRFSALPQQLQWDIKEFFGSYRAAIALGERLLFSAGDLSGIAAACRAASVGKMTPYSLYVHTSATGRLPPLLRVYKGCAEALLGVVDGATLVKFSFDKPLVSFLAYPDFDRTAHPALAWSMYAHLGQLRTGYNDYSDTGSPPILHRKEDFVADEYPGRGRFARLTRQEVRAGLFSDPATIGTKRQWSEVLASRHVEIRGHRLVRTKAGSCS